MGPYDQLWIRAVDLKADLIQIELLCALSFRRGEEKE